MGLWNVLAQVFRGSAGGDAPNASRSKPGAWFLAPGVTRQVRLNAEGLHEWVDPSELAAGSVTAAKLSAAGGSNGQVLGVAGGVVTFVTASSVALASTDPAALAGAASVGVGTTAARADHVHSTAGLAVLGTANTFVGLQSFTRTSATWGAPVTVAEFTHTPGGGSSWHGVAVSLGVKPGADPREELGLVVARAHGSGSGGTDQLVEMRPTYPAGTNPTTGLRVRCDVDAAVRGVEVLLAGVLGSPIVQPCLESGTGDVSLEVRPLGAGVVQLVRPVDPAGTVGDITGGVGAFAAPVSGQRAFAVNGRKPGEGPAAGSGVPAFFDGAAWFSCCDGAALVA